MKLFDAFSPTWSAPASDASVEVATNVAIGVSGNVTALGWYRQATTAGIAPTRLRLIDGASGQVVVSVTAPTDSGAVGWQWSDLGASFPVYAGRWYKVCAYWSGTSHYSSWGSNVSGQGNYPLTVHATERCYDYDGDLRAGGTCDNGAVFNADLEYEPGTTTPPDVVTEPALDENLAAWLRDDNENSHKAADTLPGLPWTIKAALDSFRTAFDNVVGGVSETASATGTLFQRTNELLGRSATLLTRVPATLGTGFDQLFSWFGAAGRPVGADSLPTAIDAIRTAIDADVGVELLRERLTLSPDLADTARWTLVGTTPGAGDGAVTDQADLYLLSIVAAPPLANSRGIGAYTWYPRWGWVAPLVKGHARERQFHDFDFCAITAGGPLMDGLLVHTSTGWEWSVEAWVLDRA